MHLEVLVSAVAEKLRAAGPEVGEPGNVGEEIVAVLIVPPIRTATRSEDNTLPLAMAVGHVVQIGLSELEATSALAGPRLRADDGLLASY